MSSPLLTRGTIALSTADQHSTKLEAKSMKAAKMSTEDAPKTMFCLGSNHFLFYQKNSKSVKLLCIKKGSEGSVDLGFPITLAAVSPQDELVVAGEDGTVVLIKASVEVSGKTTTTEVAKQCFGKRLTAIAVRNETVAALAEDGSVFCMKMKNETANVSTVRGPTSVAAHFITLGEKRIYVPMNNRIDILSLDSYNSVLSAPWEPHEEAVTCVHVLHKRPGLLLTAANKGKELRLWSVSENSPASLRSEVRLSGGAQDESFRVRIAPEEDYIVLYSASTHPRALVVTLHQGEMRRATEWSLPEFVDLALNTVCRGKGEEMTLWLHLFLRTKTEVSRVELPAEIDGVSNIAGMVSSTSGATAATSPSSSWPGKAPATPSTPGSVTSSLRPAAVTSSKANKSVDAVAAEKAAAAAISSLGQAAVTDVRSLLLNGSSVPALRSEIVRAMNQFDAESEAEVKRRAVEFVKRNEDRFGRNNNAATAAPGALSAELSSFCQHIGTDVGRKVEEECIRVFPGHIASIIAAVDENAVPTMPSLGATPSMQKFRNAVDAHNHRISELLNKEKVNQTKRGEEVLGYCTNMSKNAINNSKLFMKQLNEQLAGLKQDISLANNYVASFGAAANANPVETAMKQMEEKQYNAAINTITSACRVPELVEFLGKVRDTDEDFSFITEVSLPLFAVLFDQLTHDMTGIPGMVPLRIELIELLALGYMDRLDSYAGLSPSDPKYNEFDAALPILARAKGVLSQLGRKDMDRKSIKALRTVDGILESIKK